VDELKKYQEHLRDMYALVLQGKMDEAFKKAQDGALKYEATYKALGETLRIKEDLAKRRYESALAVYASSRETSIVLVVAGLLLALVLGWVISQMIARPLKNTVTILEAMARGDLTQEVTVDRKDEIGRMAEALSACSATSATPWRTRSAWRRTWPRAATNCAGRPGRSRRG